MLSEPNWLPFHSVPDVRRLRETSVRSRRIAANIVETWSDLRLPELIDYAACYTGVSVDDLIDRTQTYEVVDARRVAYWICHRAGVFSYPLIGRAFGRHHTSVLCGARKARADIEAGRKPRPIFDVHLALACRERFLNRFHGYGRGTP
jgi:chromosomal replication initiation ATPase DnaA